MERRTPSIPRTDVQYYGIFGSFLRIDGSCMQQSSECVNTLHMYVVKIVGDVHVCVDM